MAYLRGVINENGLIKFISKIHFSMIIDNKQQTIPDVFGKSVGKTNRAGTIAKSAPLGGGGGGVAPS